ncbi:MAG TPA: FecR family protein [Candidatus Dormibacteraeota bacterium]
MAAQPPPVVVTQQAAPPPAAQKSSGCFGRGCGFSCVGCLAVLVLAGLLVAGSGYWFFVVQASAAVSAPANLVVYSQQVTVDGKPADTGQALNAGNEVATQTAGRAAIQFPDGSYVKMSPSTDVVINAVKLQKTGNLDSVDVVQKAGRTLVNVQHLVSGAQFKVGGHSVSAQVRGTEFEVLVRQDNTNLIKVFDGTVKVAGRTEVTLNAGQEIDASANGTLSAPRAIRPDRQDPYPLVSQCRRAVAAGSNPGTIQITEGGPISSGQTANVEYNSPGGITRTALCYPGSYMQLRVTNPQGVAYWFPNGDSPIRHQHQGTPGTYRATVIAVNVSPAEPWVVAFAADPPCALAPEGGTDTGAFVRQTLSSSQMQKGLEGSGITLKVQGTSSNSARLYYYSNVGGTEISWTIAFYAATPNLGAVITQVTIRGVNVTTQVLKYISSAGAESISSIPQDFTVDRVYSCKGPGGDNIMVIEGHR